MLATAGCSSPTYPGVTPTLPPDTSPGMSVTSSAANAAAGPAARSCTALLRPGRRVTLNHDKGLSCIGPDGGTVTLMQVICRDGAHRLSQVQPGHPYPPGWVSAPGAYHATAGRPDQDPGYLAAEQSCMAGT
jgi:hypothetical protein